VGGDRWKDSPTLLSDKVAVSEGQKMRKVILGYVSAIDSVNEWVGRILKYAVLAMTGMLFIEVVARYGFNKPTFWAHETTAQVFGAYMLLAGGYCLLHSSHVKIEVFWRLLSCRKQAILDLITSVVFFTFIILLTWQAADRAWISIQFLECSPSLWRPYVFPLKTLTVVAVFLVFLQGTVKFIRDIYTLRGIELD